MLVEPFAGGGIVSLTVAFEMLASKVVMVELDSQVASVWKAILNDDDRQWLQERIANFEVNTRSVQAEMARSDTSVRGQAFKTILKNRTFHAGILAAGSGLIKNGENGKGIRSRWYPATLCRRIANIGSVKERIRFIEGDGLLAVEKYASRRDVVFFIDPPYTMAGKRAGRRLYTFNDIDHDRLFELAEGIKGDFIMTYDNDLSIQATANRHGFACRPVAMKNTHHATMTELIIGRNLSWLDKCD